MTKIKMILLFFLFTSRVLAQDILYSEKTEVNMWNNISNSWVPILERNDTVTFILTKDHSTLLMYCRGSGSHFKYFYKENGKDMMRLSKDTTFYKIVSSESIKDIDGDSGYIINTKSGAQNKDYVFCYYKNQNMLVCIFNDNTGRMVGNLFHIKSGFIK